MSTRYRKQELDEMFFGPPIDANCVPWTSTYEDMSAAERAEMDRLAKYISGSGRRTKARHSEQLPVLLDDDDDAVIEGGDVEEADVDDEEPPLSEVFFGPPTGHPALDWRRMSVAERMHHTISEGVDGAQEFIETHKHLFKERVITFSVDDEERDVDYEDEGESSDKDPFEKAKRKWKESLKTPCAVDYIAEKLKETYPMLMEHLDPDPLPTSVADLLAEFKRELEATKASICTDVLKDEEQINTLWRIHNGRKSVGIARDVTPLSFSRPRVFTAFNGLPMDKFTMSSDKLMDDIMVPGMGVGASADDRELSADDFGKGIFTAVIKSVHEGVDPSPDHTSIFQICGGCAELCHATMVCSRCYSDYYCNVGCQALAWARHRLVCVPICRTCKRSSKDLVRCSGCHTVYYCNAECQRSDYASHRVVCAGAHIIIDPKE